MPSTSSCRRSAGTNSSVRWTAAKLSSSTAETGCRAYLSGYRCSMPWNKRARNVMISAGFGKRSLDRDHYGMERSRNALSFLAVRAARPQRAGAVSGRPSGCQQDLDYQVRCRGHGPQLPPHEPRRLLRDETDIAVTTRPIDAMPGRGGCAAPMPVRSNPLLLDEIDKMGNDSATIRHRQYSKCWTPSRMLPSRPLHRTAV